MTKRTEHQVDLFRGEEVGIQLAGKLPAETIQKTVVLLGELLLQHFRHLREVPGGGGDDSGQDN